MNHPYKKEVFNWTDTRFLEKKHFYKQRQAEIGKKSNKC